MIFVRIYQESLIYPILHSLKCLSCKWVKYFTLDEINSNSSSLSFVNLLHRIIKCSSSSISTRFFKNPLQNHILKKQNAMKLKFTHFPVIKNTIKRIVFKNAYESSIIFKSVLYASIPAESTSYAPTFFQETKAATGWDLSQK